MLLPEGGIIRSEMLNALNKFKIRDIEYLNSLELLRLRNIQGDNMFYQNSAPVDFCEHENWVGRRVKDYKNVTLALEINLNVVGIACIDSLTEGKLQDE